MRVPIKSNVYVCICMNINVVQETTPICRSCLVCAYPFRISSTLGIKANNLQSPDTATDKWKSYLCVPDRSRVCVSLTFGKLIYARLVVTQQVLVFKNRISQTFFKCTKVYFASIKYYSVCVCIQKLLIC